MKFETTKKRMRDNYHTILSLGYCKLQTLLNYESPIAYSHGVYGWSCDYYVIDNVLISTGYSPIGQDVDSKLVKEYEQKAEDVRTKHYDDRSIQIDVELNKLLKEFIQKAIS